MAKPKQHEKKEEKSPQEKIDNFNTLLSKSVSECRLGIRPNYSALKSALLSAHPHLKGEAEQLEEDGNGDLDDVAENLRRLDAKINERLGGK